MSTNGAFTIGLFANTADATKKLAAVNKQLASMQAPAKAFAKQMEKFGDLSGINKLTGGLKSVATGAASAASSLTKIITPLGAITGAASVAGVYKLISSFSEFGTVLLNTSNRLSMTTASLHSYQSAARLAGSSSDAITSGLKSLGDMMQDAVAGRAPEAVMMFNALGVSFRKSALEAKTAEEVLPQLADKIASIKNPTIQAQLATKLFGASADQLLPFLKRGSAGIAEYRAMAIKYGVVNENAAIAADSFRFSQTKLTLAVEGFGNSLSEKLSPVISPILDYMSEWISLNREWLAGEITGYVKDFAKWLKTIDWKSVGIGIREWIDWAGKLETKLDTVVHVGEAFLGLWAVSKVTGVVMGIARITTAMSALGAATTAASTAAGGAGLLGILGKLSLALGAGFLAHEATGAIDGDSAISGWIDRNVPGASWLDHQASRLGLGRSYREQEQVNQAARLRGNNTPVDSTVPAEGRGLLNSIAAGESNGYGDQYGSSTPITDFSKHPGVYNTITSGPNAGQKSSAAGRYQFIESTWKEAAAALGLKDFSPASQDKAAWWLAQKTYRQKTGGDLSTDLRSTNPAVRAGIGPALSGVWTSAPGGAESRNTSQRFMHDLDRNVRNETKRDADAAALQPPMAAPPAPTAPATAPAATDMTHKIDGNVQVSVNVAGAPAGSTIASSATGNAIGGAPRVSVAMPGLAP